MSEVKHVLKAFRDDQIGYVHEQEVGVLEDPLAVANSIADRFGFGAYVGHNLSGLYMYEDGEILTYFTLTPLR